TWCWDHRWANGSRLRPYGGEPSVQYLSDRDRMLVLPNLVEVDGAKNRIQPRSPDRVAHRCMFGRAGALDRIRQYLKRDVGLDTVIRRFVARSRSELLGPFARAGPFCIGSPLGHRDCVLGRVTGALQKIGQRESGA